jgi:Lrp/AsnC family leucine-responsive transcriptional regulator
MLELDSIDRQILDLLQADDQISLAEIGRAVGLAASSVTERIRKLTQGGAIRAFRAQLAPEALGLDLLAFMYVGWNDPATEPRFLARIADERAILECHHVTGAWNYLLKVRVRGPRDLEGFLNSVIKGIPGLQRTETLIVLSSAKETTVLPVDAPHWSVPARG